MKLIILWVLECLDILYRSNFLPINLTDIHIGLKVFLFTTKLVSLTNPYAVSENPNADFDKYT